MAQQPEHEEVRVEPVEVEAVAHVEVVVGLDLAEEMVHVGEY